LSRRIRKTLRTEDEGLQQCSNTGFHHRAGMPSMKEDGGGNQSSHHSYKGERSATREPINMNMERLGHSNVYYKNNFNFNFVKKT